MFRKKKSTLDRVFTDIKNKKSKKPKNKFFRGLLYSTVGLAASAGILAGGYLINQYPNENRYNIEKKIVLPLLETGRGIFYDKPLNEIEQIELDSFENHVAYKCFNKNTNENDLVFYKNGDNKPIALDSISEIIKNSVLAVEDPYFRETENMSLFDGLRVHRGVDWLSTFRAFYNTKIRNRTLQGGSTITQQVLKKTLDNDNVIDRSSRYDLKLEEILLAGDTEEKFGKDKILETYINSIYMGNKISGIGASIENYFGLNEVNKANYKQALTVVAAISNPNGILSRNNGVLYELSRGKETAELTPRQRSSLNTWIAKYNQGAKTLHETLGVIDKEKYNDIKINNEKIEDYVLDLQLREFDVTTRKEETGDLADIITRHVIENDFVIDGNVVSGSYLLNEYPGVVEITTAIDPEKNKMLKEKLHTHMDSDIFKQGLKPIGVDTKTLLENIHPSGVITNHEGHILAYYPSKEPTKIDFLSYTKKSTNSIINTGSTLKPIIMYFVNSLENKPVDEKFLPNKPVYKNKPRNWDGRNNPELEFSIEETLRQSINRPTAQAWMKYPRVRKAVCNMLDDYGLEVFKGQSINDYSISLGTDIEYPLLIPAL
ncbi:MAG: transglycosylase domain-containing protein, partial [Nanoarchaeota archaeon]